MATLQEAAPELSKFLDDHLHCQMLIAPNLAPFDVHFVEVTLDNNAQYQFGIYTGLGGAEVLVTSFTFARTGVQERSFPVPVHMKIVPVSHLLRIQMATLQEAAPELSKFFDVTAATAFADKAEVAAPAKPSTRTIVDLTKEERDIFFLWLKWFGEEVKPKAQAYTPPTRQGKPEVIGPYEPGVLPYWYNDNSSQVAARHGMDAEYVLGLIKERKACEKEIVRGAEAFTPDSKPKEEPVDPGLEEPVGL